ncbi:carboxyl-terminal processing protease [[Eubacterium] yurii]|jgi:peptidase, S41 family|nr:MAG: S41 family peptidase [Lachnospiraceae bacterium]SKC48218.1 carboxyl-terminal processing protease [[Eubacterium] yurii]
MNGNTKSRIINVFLGFFIGLAVFAAAGMLVVKASGFSFEEYMEIKQFENLIRQTYYKDTDNIDFVEGMKKGMVEQLGDPYSKYLNKEEFKRMMEDTAGNFVGIGVYIAPNKNGEIVVVSPIKDTPAEKAGIKSGDIISTVDGQNYDAKTMNEAVKAMRGEKGKTVVVGILDSKRQYKEYKIVREDIKTETVFSRMLDNNLGYIQIKAFEERTASEFREHLTKLKKNNIKGLVLDLRSNPGGLVDQVTSVADQILPEALIVYSSNRIGEKQYAKSDNKESLKIPIVMLVNEGSASASEILSGALQDNKKATILGVNTFGKGVIQSVLEMDKGGLVITTAQYFTPNGNVVDKKGIKPDVKVDYKKTGENKDSQLDKAIEILKQKVK